MPEAYNQWILFSDEGAAVAGLKPGALEPLGEYHWPGNVRELENMVERALILNRRGPIEFEEMSIQQTNSDAKKTIGIEPGSLLVDQVVSRHIQSVLEMTQGKINGKNGAAELLGLNASTLRHKLRKMAIPFGRRACKKRKPFSAHPAIFLFSIF